MKNGESIDNILNEAFMWISFRFSIENNKKKDSFQFLNFFKNKNFRETSFHFSEIIKYNRRV